MNKTSKEAWPTFHMRVEFLMLVNKPMEDGFMLVSHFHYAMAY